MLVYATFAIVAMSGVAMLAVDWGRVQCAKTEAQAFADAAARHAAAGLQNVLGGQSVALPNAAAVAAESRVDGVGVRTSEMTTEMGVWTVASRTFVATGTPAGANAVRVTFRRALGAGASPLSFASIFGVDKNVAAVAVASVSTQTQTAFAPADGNLWLAAMPTGTVTKNFRPDDSRYWDTAGPNGETPAVVNGGIMVAPGSVLTFDGADGTGTFNVAQANATSPADGDPNAIVCHGGAWFMPATMANFASPENGIANLKVPINSLVGVYLDASDPRGSAAPTPLDFSTAAARDFTTLKPQLKQPFFIGDGRRANGEVQQFTVPAGATRLYIGMMDAWEWRGNAGGFTVSAHAAPQIITRK